GARWAIQDAGGRAIRFWHDEGIGYGRAWVVPKDGDWFVFNAYGPDLEVVHERLEVIYPQAKIRKVNLENWGDVYGLVYINRSGLGLQVTERTIDTNRAISVDLEIGDDEYENTCYDCGRRMDEDDTYYVDGNAVCRWCYEDNYY